MTQAIFYMSHREWLIKNSISTFSDKISTPKELVHGKFVTI